MYDIINTNQLTQGGFIMDKKSLSNPLINSVLQKPGDEMSARITNSGRQVVKISKDNGNTKYSATRYATGTVVETKTTKSN